jgi:signal transduction histidine kinase/CheY-like chemotaxis protein
MSKKQLHNRINDLFKEFDLIEPVETNPVRDFVTGWYWECTPDGEYLSCSSEVFDCLGIPPTVFRGKSIFAFRISPDSTQKLNEAFLQGSFPFEVDVVFLNHQEETIPARMNILTQTGEHGHEPRWQGFVQVMPGNIQDPLQPSSAPGLIESSTPFERPMDFGAKVNQPARESGNQPPADQFWTQAGYQSFNQQQLVASTGKDAATPSVMAVPLNLKDKGVGVLEIVDDADQRRWTEDERLLAQEVAAQLALALENAQLYQTVQQELSERTRAEHEIFKRNQELAILNQAGQQLSRLTSTVEIFDLLYMILGQLLDNRNLSIALFNSAQRTVAYPVYVVGGVKQSLEPASLENDIPGYLFWTKMSLLLTHNVAAELLDRGITPPDPMPASLLAIPMLAGERPVGAIILKNLEQENAYSSIHVELLSTLASQASTALENANLFQEIRTALAAIENRERYQANVAVVAATLSKYGSKSMPEVLGALGDASQSSRVYFALSGENGSEGSFWNVVNQWVSPGSKAIYENSKLTSIPKDRLPYITDQIRETGWVAKPSVELPAPDSEFFLEQQVRSILILNVPVKGSLPSFIVFEQVDLERTWQLEEIRILQIATDALSNTILRENLLKQVQVSLHETENLYNLSHNLALATRMDEMLALIPSGLHMPEINRGSLLLFEYDPQQKLASMKAAASWHNGVGVQPQPAGYSYDPGQFAKAFLRSTPAFFDNISEAPLEPQVREAWLRENIHSAAVLPLWTGKRQTGVLLLESGTKEIFTDQIRRTVPALVDQLATSVENMRLYQETQKALADTGMLYQISDAISRAGHPEDLVMVVASYLMPSGADRVALSILNLNNEGKPAEIEMIGAYDIHSKYKRIGTRYPASSLKFFVSLPNEFLLVPNIRSYPMDDDSRRVLQESNSTSACIVPLITGGRRVGFITLSSKGQLSISQDEIHNLQIAANGIAVALEKQRLLREAQRRALELQTAAELARDTTSTLSLDHLLNRMVNLLCERFDFYHASIFLLNNTKTYAVIRESTGEAGKEMKERSHKLAVGSRSIIGTVSASGEPLIINDVNQSPIFFPNPLLPETRSEMGIPLKLGPQVIGALDIQSQRINAFSPDDVAVLQILADQVAIAIENARAYEISQKAIEEMRELDRMKSQFLANMSHELRTPLNSIIGFSRVIMKGIDGPINETQGQDLNAIYNSGQHLLSLINDILDLSKIEAGKLELSFSDVNLAEMVNSVMSTAAGLIKGKPVRLLHKIPDDLPLVQIDNTRIRQVLLNLISNASKFTDEGSITIEAMPVNEKTKPQIMVTVTDTGTGIASEHTHKLFQPFSQVDDSPTRKTGGTGLGLSICRSLVEMHGGRIGLLRSEVGLGSTFFFTLPISHAEPEPEPEIPSADAKVILCIDDDAQVISLYERYLKPHGYHLVALTNPMQAVEKAKEIHPSAITLDIMMPERDGWQVMRDLKNDPDTRNIPIVICSILEEEEKGFNLGAADYIVKPFAQDDLMHALQRLNTMGNIQNILVIDDSPADARLVEKMLTGAAGYHVRTVEGGKAGWESIKTSSPDAIILDLFMPGLNGFDILERMRTSPELCTIPVIILTGADLTAEQQQQLSEFGRHLLAKGHFNEKELLKSLEVSLSQIYPSIVDPLSGKK